MKTKFVYSDEPIISVKLTGIKTPHFRPTTQRTTKATSKKQQETTPTSTETVDIDTTSETTTEDSTTSVAFDDNDDTSEDFSTTKSSVDNENEHETEQQIVDKADKVETMLFQDMEDEASKKKVSVNYKVQGM